MGLGKLSAFSFLAQHVSPQLTTVPTPGTHSVATYRSIEFAFAVHGHEESTFDTEYAHHASFHRRNFQKTYTGDTEIRGTNGSALECVVTALCSPSVDPHIPVLLWAATGSHPTCSPMPHAGTSLLLAKCLFLFCPQASFGVDKVKISQSTLRANETFVIIQLTSPLPDLIVSVGYESHGATGLSPQQMLFKFGVELSSPQPLLRAGGPGSCGSSRC